MNFLSTGQHVSEFDPEVSFNLRKLSYKRRLRIDLALAEHRARLREYTSEYRAIAEEDVSREAYLRRSQLDQLTRLAIEEHFKPVYILEALESITGLTIDGFPATVELLLSDGPEELVTEIYDKIQTNIGLNPGQVKN